MHNSFRQPLFARLVELCDDSRPLAWLLTANAGVSLVAMLAMLACVLAREPDTWLVQFLSLPGDASLLPARPWTVATYMFTQFSPLHLIFNVLWLFWFGKILLLSVTSRHIVWLYFGGALTGAAAFLIVGTVSGEGGRLVGSSAAVMAVMTAAAMLMPDRHVNFLLVGAVRLKWVAGAAVLLTFLGIGGGSGGAQSAHIGGVAFGLAWGLAVRHRTRHPAHRHEEARPKPVVRDARPVAEALKQHLDDRQKLDRLLDKISVSGYNALSDGERRELKELSDKL